jgi:hypothetical protein
MLMSVRRVQNPGERGPSAPFALPMFCYAGWASWVNPESTRMDIYEQARQLEIQGEAIKAAGEAMRQAAERVADG